MTSLNKLFSSAALKISLIYLMMAGLWILLSDHLALLFFVDASTLSKVQTYKGDFFITLTALLLYLLVKRALQQQAVLLVDLQKTRERLKHIIEITPTIIYALAIKPKPEQGFSVSYLSNNAQRIIGYSIEEWESAPDFWLQHVHPDDRQQALLAQQELFSTGALRHQYRFLFGSGEYHWIDDQLRLTCDSNGQPVEIIGTWTDITEQKHAQLKLEAQEWLLRKSQRVAKLGSWQLETQFNKVIWTDETYRIFGINAESFTSHWPDFLTLLEAEDRSKLEMWITQCLHDKNPGPLVFRTLLPNGHIRVIEWQGELFRQEQDQQAMLMGTVQDITDRAQIEHELRENRHKLELFIKYAPVAIAMFDKDMRYISCSRRWQEDYSLNSQDILGLSHYQVFPEIPENWKQVHQRALAGEVIRCDEDRFIRSDGSEHWERWEVRPWHIKQNVVGGIVIFSEDITDRKQAEILLAESEQRWKFAIDGSDLGLWDWNITDNTVYFSSRFKAMLGYTDAEISNQLFEWQSRVHPDDWPKVMRDVECHFAGETEFYANEHRVRCKQGHYIWIMDRGKVIEFDSDGKPLRMIGTHTDLSAIKQREQELSLNAQVFKHSLEGIMICSLDQVIVSVNKAFTDITGYSAEEAIGQKPSLIKSNSHDDNFYADMWRHIHQTGGWKGEIWNRRKNGEIYPEWLSIKTAYGDDGKPSHYFAIFSDITQRKLTEEHIIRLAHYDPLTEVPNRTLFKERAQYYLKQAHRKKQSLAVLFIDLDRFKNVNDSLGHNLGDKLLIEVADRLQSTVREDDIVSRLGGDEFALLLPETDSEGAAHVAGKIIMETAKPFLIDGHDLNITPSIGIAMYPIDGEDFESLLQSSDTAMYRAKNTGRNSFQFYTADMHSHASRVLKLENALRRALEREELSLYYQPQFDIHGQRMIGCEALLRWRHPDLGMISPADFIPIAEESGQILTIGEWVLNTAARQHKLWQQAGWNDSVMAINLSAAQFRQANFIELVERILAETQLAPGCLELELTESIMMDDPEAAIVIIAQLHQLGIKLSIDDFGTGYSSLSYLKRFNINKLKIDQSFVRDVVHDVNSESIVIAVISLAHSLGLNTIAEGVETQEQLSFLREKGCDEIQGYLLGRPMSAEQFTAFLSGYNPRWQNSSRLY